MEDRFENFTTLVLQFNRYIQKIKALEMKKFDLHSSHTMILYLLHKHPDGLTPLELIKYCKEDKAQVSRAINFLIKEGYVVKKAEQTMKYKVRHVLTDKGNDIALKMCERIDFALSIASKGLSEVRRQELYNSLNIIMKNLAENYDVLD